MKYLVIDAMLNGTGIRDKHEGGYINPQDLGISDLTINQLNDWLSRYEIEHYNGFSNHMIIDELDKEGKEIARRIKNELSDIKLEYYSDARLSNEII